MPCQSMSLSYQIYDTNRERFSNTYIHFTKSPYFRLSIVDTTRQFLRFLWVTIKHKLFPFLQEYRSTVYSSQQHQYYYTLDYLISALNFMCAFVEVSLPEKRIYTLGVPILLNFILLITPLHL